MSNPVLRGRYLSAQHVIAYYTDIDAVTHYGKTTSFLDANLTLELLNRKLDERASTRAPANHVVH